MSDDLPPNVVHLPAPGQLTPPSKPPVGKAQLTRAGKLSRAQKRSKILALRAAGATYDQIEQAMRAQGYPTTKSAITRIIGDALAELSQHDEQQVDKVRALQVERLDTALRAIWPRVRDGDLKAIDRMLQIERTRAKICGTEAPTQVQVDGEVTHRVSQDEADRELQLWASAGGEVIDGTADELPALGA